MLEKSLPCWKPESMSVELLLSTIDSGRFNINPPHQRDVVHNDTWKADIISSVFETGCIPETFWHPRPDKPFHYDSVDGKQRCCAFRDYLNDRFKWKDRYFSELPMELQMHIKSFTIIVNKADKTLTDKQLRDTFNRFQVTKQTKLGEQWNADACPLQRRLQQFVQRDEDNLHQRKVFLKRSPNRHQLLELYGTLFAYYTTGHLRCTRKMIEAKWEEYRQLHVSEQNSHDWKRFDHLLSDMWLILESNPSVAKQQVTTRARPLFGMLMRLIPSKRDQVVKYVQTSLSTHEEKYEKIGGCHTAHSDRMIVLMHSIREGFSPSPQELYVQDCKLPFS